MPPWGRLAKSSDLDQIKMLCRFPVPVPTSARLMRLEKSSYLVWNRRRWDLHEHLLNDHPIDGAAVYFKCGAHGLCEQNNLQLSLIRADLHCNHYLFVQSRRQIRHYARSSIIRHGILLTVTRCPLTSHHPLRVLRTKYLPFYKSWLRQFSRKGVCILGLTLWAACRPAPDSVALNGNNAWWMNNGQVFSIADVAMSTPASRFAVLVTRSIEMWITNLPRDRASPSQIQNSIYLPY